MQHSIWNVIALLIILSITACLSMKVVTVQKEITVDKDADDLRDYTPLELQALKELVEIKKGRSFISEIMPPTCEFPEWTEATCCVGFKWLGSRKEFCLGAELVVNDLVLRVSLIYNEDTLFSYDVSLARFCIGIPLLKKLKACLAIYHLDIDLTSKPIFFRLCSQIIVASILELRLNCLTFSGGHVTFDTAVEPEEAGMIVVNFKDGRAVFEFNNPIPPELIEALKSVGTIIKQTFVELGKKVVEVAKKVWDTIKSWFTWWW